jgi:ferredoxin
MNLIEKPLLRLIQRKVSNWFDLERAQAKIYNGFSATDGSPEKSWPDPAKIPAGGEIPFTLKNIFVVGKYLKSSINQGMKALQSLDRNPSKPKSTISPEKLQGFERYATSLGIGAMGYAKIPRQLIFKDRAVLYDSAIVLLKEMPKEKVDKAPSIETFKMVFESYDSLSRIVNQLTDYLRKEGYGAQAGYPLGGLNLYPPLATAAGLGWMGRHGLLITPQFGPRQRIGAIFTSIDDLPFAESNSHSWIAGFCKTCGRCIRSCPEEAIRERPLIHASGRKTHIVREKCLPFFVTKHGCTICVKECSFSKTPYADIFKSVARFQEKKETNKQEQSVP